MGGTLKPKRKITVLGAGSWGTVLAHHLVMSGHEVTLWGRDAQILREVTNESSNRRYLGEAKLAAPIKAAERVTDAVSGAELVVVAIPSSGVRALMTELRGKIQPATMMVSATKGLERETNKTMSEVIGEALGGHLRVAVLSGPSFAREVVRGLPTAVTMAAVDISVAEEAARCFHHEYFRVYTSHDVIGVEFGGAVKNVIAIAVGVIDGAGMGANARAALITRGLAEIQRVVEAVGGNPATVMGLSGLGDLLLTATGDLSRNRRVGLELAKGEKLDKILTRLDQVAEGVETTDKVLSIARKHQVSTPIVEQVAKLIAGKVTAKESISALLARAPKTE